VDKLTISRGALTIGKAKDLCHDKIPCCFSLSVHIAIRAFIPIIKDLDDGVKRLAKKVMILRI
jgi:hypothetical protein